jgi:hypothetical protein
MVVPTEAIEDLAKVLRVIIRKAGLLGAIGDVARDIIDN